MHGARVIALRGNFDEALTLVRELVPAPPDRARQLGQPVPARGAEDRRRSRSLDELGDDSTRCASRSATRATSPRTGRASREAGAGAADARLPGRGRRAAGARRAGREPGDGRERDPDRQPGALGGGDGGDDRARTATIARGHRRARSSTPTASWPRSEGVFCEPASRRRRSPGCWRTAPRAPSASSACSPATGSRTRRPRSTRPASVVPCEPEHRRGRAGRPRAVRRRRRVRVPASSANLGPGFDVLARRAGPAHRARGGRDRALRRRTPTCAIAARPPQPRRARRSRALHPPDDFEFRIRSDIPLSGGLGHERGGARRRAAGRRLDLRARRRRARRSPPRSRAIPDNVAAALLGGFVLCADGRADALRRRRRARGGARRARTQPVRTAKARAALPAEVPIATPCSTSRTPSLLVLGLARGDLDLVARGLADRLHQPRRAHLYPRSMELVRARAASSARSARRSPAPARPCSSGRQFEATGGVVARLRARGARAGPRCCACPFEPQGADVRALT